MRAKYPSLPPSHSGSGQRSFNACERPRICHELQRVLLSWLRARSPCQEQPCKADTTSSTSYEGTIILELPSGKITFSPPLERHGGGGERIFGKEREECVVFELRLRAKEVRKRGWATPRIFSFFFFFSSLRARSKSRIDVGSRSRSRGYQWSRSVSIFKYRTQVLDPLSLSLSLYYFINQMRNKTRCRAATACCNWNAAYRVLRNVVSFRFIVNLYKPSCSYSNFPRDLYHLELSLFLNRTYYVLV